MMASSTGDEIDDDNVKRAIEILRELSDVRPQYATPDTVAQLAEAAGLLNAHEGSSLWFQVCDRWASHVLEVKEGDHHDNVIAAREIYSWMVAQAENTSSFDDWFTAHVGLGNTFLFDPAVSPEEILAVAEFFDKLLPVVKENASPWQVAVTLGCTADAHARIQLGDVDGALDTAIRLQSEAVALLSGLTDPESFVRLAHAQYNLGRSYAERRVGVRSQNIDRAIHALMAALDLRPAHTDPLGRARVLRALALLLPEWSAPASRDQAEQMADEAEREATWLTQSDSVPKAQQDSLMTQLQRSQSALRIKLDWLYAQPHERRRELLASVRPETLTC